MRLSLEECSLQTCGALLWLAEGSLGELAWCSTSRFTSDASVFCNGSKVGATAKYFPDLPVSRLAAALLDGRGRSGGDLGLCRLCSSEKREGIVRLGSKERSRDVSANEGTQKREERFWCSAGGLSYLGGGEESASGESDILKVPSGLGSGETGDVGVDLLFGKWEYTKEFEAMSVPIIGLCLESK